MPPRPAAPVAFLGPTANNYLARSAYRLARSAGLAVRPLLARAGLTREELERPGRVAVRAQVKFLELVADTLDDDLLGFHIAEHAELREAGLLYYVLASSETLAEVLQRGERYSSLGNEGIVAQVIGGKGVGFGVRYSGVNRRLDRQMMEFWMTAVVIMVRRLTGKRLVPSRVRMLHSRKHGRREMNRYFGCDIEFDAAVDEITFPKEAGQLPVVNADPYLNRLLVQYCEEAITHRARRRLPFRARVEDAIVPLLPHAKARAAEIARRLGVSQRTLARRLKHEGVTFSEVLHGLRLDLAHRYLRDKEMSISHIAWLLGYQTAAAFSHAFKHWTGKTPSQAAAPRP